MKRFYSFIIALMMILMSISVYAHDECIGEVGSEFISSDTSASVNAVPCGHNDFSYLKIKEDASCHTVYCETCGRSVKEPHNARQNCLDTKCDKCGYRYTIDHSYEWLTTNYTEGSEEHSLVCTKYYYPYGYCNYIRATYSCRPYAEGATDYEAASKGYHKYYRWCSVCGIRVYMGKIECVSPCDYCP